MLRIGSRANQRGPRPAATSRRRPQTRPEDRARVAPGGRQLGGHSSEEHWVPNRDPSTEALVGAALARRSERTFAPDPPYRNLLWERSGLDGNCGRPAGGPPLATLRARASTHVGT